MIERRDFIKKAAISTVGLTTINSLTDFSNVLSNTIDENCEIERNKEITKWNKWKIDFNEANKQLTLLNQNVKLTGKLSFISKEEEWQIYASRDGVTNRNTLVDLHGNVQGYCLFNQHGGNLELLFYHRTAQDFKGHFSYEGTISFLPDSFPCRTKPSTNEKVLQLICGTADSLLNDSLFSPQNDTLLQLSATNLHLLNKCNGIFDFKMSGYIDEGAESKLVFFLENHYFENSYTPYYQPIDRNRCPVAPTGWMSWNTYFDKATAEDNLAEAKIGQKYLLPFGCDIWSIESWQENSDKLPVRDFYNMNLEVNKKQFPKGMKQLAEDIRKLGFKPGIWMAPFGTGNDKFYKKHKNWFLHDKSGKPISSWNGKYTLDPTVKEAREHLREIHRIASKEWGYEFFKIDGMSGRNHGYCAHLYERPEIKAQFNDPSCSNPFELCVKAFRDGMGEDRIFLACQGHTSGPEAKYADASRIGADIVHPNQPVKWEGVLNQASCLLNQVFTHNIVMFADPDTLLVRDLPLEEARTSATIVAFPGQLTFFGDKLAGLEEKKMKILQQTLPVANVRPASLYPYFKMLSVWNLSVNHPKLGSYNVVAFFNWENQEKKISTTTEELGIADTEYIGIEFWESNLFQYRITDYELSMNVPAHGVRIVTLHPIKETPQWLGSDRHITQNGIEVLDIEWENEKKHLTGKIQSVGSFPLTMYFRVPNTYLFKGVECGSSECHVTNNQNILSITFISKESCKIDFLIKFN